MPDFGGYGPQTTPWWESWNGNYLPDVYGPIYGGHSVQIAIVNTLRMWLPTYIKEFNRQLGGNILQIVQNYNRPADSREWSPDIDVEIDVTVPGTVGKPLSTNGVTGISSVWKADLEAFVYGGTNWQETLALAYAYGAAARGAIVQHQDLMGFAETTNWVADSYFKGKDVGLRWVGIATISFEVSVLNTLSKYGGPPSAEYAATGTPSGPSLLPIPNFPEAIDYDFEVDNLSPSNPNGEPSPA